ncbi:MAG: hypothetical protein ACXAEU_18205 [Candidatus Hodarchaeales archaeon]
MLNGNIFGHLPLIVVNSWSFNYLSSTTSLISLKISLLVLGMHEKFQR